MRDCHPWRGPLRGWMSNYIDCFFFLWDVIIHPSHDFNSGLNKPPLTSRHGQVITSHCFSRDDSGREQLFTPPSKWHLFAKSEAETRVFLYESATAGARNTYITKILQDVSTNSRSNVGEFFSVRMLMYPWRPKTRCDSSHKGRASNAENVSIQWRHQGHLVWLVTYVTSIWWSASSLSLGHKHAECWFVILNIFSQSFFGFKCFAHIYADSTTIFKMAYKTLRYILAIRVLNALFSEFVRHWPGLDTNGCPLGNSKFILLSDNLNICLWLSACQVEEIDQINNHWWTIY